jgi:hypothetical protein
MGFLQSFICNPSAERVDVPVVEGEGLFRSRESVGEWVGDRGGSLKHHRLGVS